MQLHPRYFLTSKAKCEIDIALLDLREKHDLTTVEFLQILNEHIATTLKYALRYERHGNQSEGGDEASDEREIEPGDRVAKNSGKPFKSTLKINTVKDATMNPDTGRRALTFEEDDSIVDAHQCYKVEEKT